MLHYIIHIQYIIIIIIMFIFFIEPFYTLKVSAVKSHKNTGQKMAFELVFKILYRGKITEGLWDGVSKMKGLLCRKPCRRARSACNVVGIIRA